MLTNGKLLSTICIAISLVSCGHKIKINHHENVAYVWSNKFQKCLMMPFIISKDLVGKSGPSEFVDISECDNITGFKNKSDKGGWPEFKTWLEIEVFENAEDHGLMDVDGYDRPYIYFKFDKGIGDNNGKFIKGFKADPE